MAACSADYSYLSVKQMNEPQPLLHRTSAVPLAKVSCVQRAWADGATSENEGHPSLVHDQDTHTKCSKLALYLRG